MKKRTNKPIEIHVHNDFGLGVANTIAAVLAGAETVHVSVNGIGERTGNASLEQTVMALKFLYGVESNVKLEKLRKVSRTVAEFARVSPPPQAPIIGDGIFTIESGIVAGWWANVEATRPLEIYPFLPELVGHEPVRVVMGKKSGRDSVLYKTKKYGINLVDQDVDEILLQLKSEAMLKKRFLSDTEFLEIVERVRARKSRTN